MKWLRCSRSACPISTKLWLGVGSMASKPPCRRPGRAGRKLAGHLDALAAYISAYPDATLTELTEWSARERGVTVCVATMWATLETLQLSHKKRHAARPSRSEPTLPRRAKSGGKPKAP